MHTKRVLRVRGREECSAAMPGHHRYRAGLVECSASGRDWEMRRSQAGGYPEFVPLYELAPHLCQNSPLQATLKQMIMIPGDVALQMSPGIESCRQVNRVVDGCTGQVCEFQNNREQHSSSTSHSISFSTYIEALSRSRTVPFQNQRRAVHAAKRPCSAVYCGAVRTNPHPCAEPPARSFAPSFSHSTGVYVWDARGEP